MQDGLADNTVSCIHRDREGFIWFGTDNGLSRYDGKTIKNFSFPDRSLKVRFLYETQPYLLWGLSGSELFCLDRRKEQFRKVYFEDTIPKIRQLWVRNDSSFWAIAANNLFLLQIQEQKNTDGVLPDLILRTKACFDRLVPPHHQFTALSGSPEGILYMGTDYGEMVRFDTNRLALLGISRSDPAPGTKTKIYRMLFSDQAVWISTLNKGIFRYDLSTGCYTHYTYSADNNIHSLSHNDVYQIVPLANHRYLAVTWNGYTLLVPDTKQPGSYLTRIYNNTVYELYRNFETHMLSAYYDPDGVLWIGTLGGGVLVSDLRLQFYQRFHQDVHNEICGMAADPDGYIWLATYNKGIMRSEQKFDPLEKLAFKPVVTDSGRTALCVVPDSEGNVWFGNNRGELTCYRKATGQFITCPVRLSGQPGWKGMIWSLYGGDSGHVWLGTTDGLIRFDTFSRRFTRFDLQTGVIRAIGRADSASIWLGTYRGLVRFHLDDHEVETGFEKSRGVPAREVRSLWTASDGSLYIGYEDGLAVMAAGSDSITSFYTTRNGLCSNFIGGITEDGKGDIWIGSNSGISRYDKHRQLFYHYYISGSNRSALMWNQYLFWGNNKNITYFDPADIVNDPGVTDTVFITRLEVDNKWVETGEKINGQTILSQGISFTDRVVLSNANNSFSLLFSDLSYGGVEQKYSYRLFPYQPDWLVCVEGEKISYAHLPQGNYVFEVKSIFPDGTDGKTTSLRLTIRPHWSETGWFRLSMTGIFLLLAGYGYKRMKRKQARIASEERLKHELALANLEREKEKQINRERANFFTNVSHELRTPLTLIVSPLHELLKSAQVSSFVRNKLTIVYKNATYLSTLADQLLYVQKIEAGMVRLHLCEADLVEVARVAVASFGQMAELKQTRLILSTELEELRVWMDVTKVDSALRNLLSNALKYTPEKGIIEVDIRKKEIDGKRFGVLSVTDTGCGISRELQAHVFDSFITGDTAPSFSTKVGIGLRIVKNTVDLHHGTVLLESEPGKGTKFTLLFPLGKEHFKDDSYEEEEEKIPGNGMPVGDCLPGGTDAEEETASKTKTGQTILIIEDNEEVRAYIAGLFQPDYIVREACNGEEGVETALREVPDLIISDIMMPVKDGFACCREIRRDFRTAPVPIIMLTAKAEDTDLLESTRLGVDDYIMKPFNPELLKAKAANLIRLRMQLKRIYTKTLMLKQTEEIPDGEEGSAFMQRIITIVESNLTNPDFNVKFLASSLNVSQPTLYRKIKQQTDLSVIELIRSIRMGKAASFIMQKKYSVQEIAEKVGYNDIATFRKHFTSQFGVSPSRYNV